MFIKKKKESFVLLPEEKTAPKIPTTAPEEAVSCQPSGESVFPVAEEGGPLPENETKKARKARLKAEKK